MMSPLKYIRKPNLFSGELQLIWVNGVPIVLLWNQCDDTFSIPGGDKISKSDKATKRDVLHSISRVFDPLGLLTPVVFYGKVLLQKLWSLNVPWDESYLWSC